QFARLAPPMSGAFHPTTPTDLPDRHLPTEIIAKLRKLDLWCAALPLPAHPLAVPFPMTSTATDLTARRYIHVVISQRVTVPATFDFHPVAFIYAAAFVCFRDSIAHGRQNLARGLSPRLNGFPHDLHTAGVGFNRNTL